MSKFRIGNILVSSKDSYWQKIKITGENRVLVLAVSEHALARDLGKEVDYDLTDSNFPEFWTIDESSRIAQILERYVDTP